MSIFANFVRGERRRQTVRALRALHPATLCDIGIEPDRIGQSVEAMLAAEADQPAPKRDNGDGFRAPAIFVQGAWPYRWGRAN